nr:MAG TPA: hypothetical protein [Caudoviricetes sp.]
MKLITHRTPINYSSHRFQLRVLLKKLPCLILGIVANLLFPRTALASPMSCVGMQGGVGCFVSVCVSFHTFKSFSVSPFYKFYFCFYFVYITRVVVAQSYNVITHAPNSCGAVVVFAPLVLCVMVATINFNYRFQIRQIYVGKIHFPSRQYRLLPYYCMPKSLAVAYRCLFRIACLGYKVLPYSTH